MALSLIILSITLCQIIFVSTAPPEPHSQQSSLQELGPEKVTVNNNMLVDYVNTDVGVYKLHNSRASWNDARNICLDENAQLAVIDTVADEAMILKHMKANGIDAVWLGVHDLFGKKQWTTITGDRLFKSQRYVHWANGEPNNAGAREHCAVLYPNGMNDLPCDLEINGFVCEKISNDFQGIPMSY